MDSCFTARTATKQSIVTKIWQLSLQRNDSKQYTHSAITQLEKGIQQVLKQQYIPAGGSNGMLDLLNQNNKGPQANETTTATDVLKESHKEADNKSKSTGKILTPKFTLCADAQDKANQRNIINQALIGAKEGILEALTTFVGTEITDTVLRRANGDYKDLDEYTLQELLQAAINGANRPPATDVLTQLLDVINYIFDFCRKISAKMEGIQTLTSCMVTYGIDISPAQVVLTLLANIKIAAHENFGREFCPALQNIQTKYPYNHVHDNASLKVILQELAKADSVHTLRDAPKPDTANAVTNMLKMMRTTVTNGDN